MHEQLLLLSVSEPEQRRAPVGFALFLDWSLEENINHTSPKADSDEREPKLHTCAHLVFHVILTQLVLFGPIALTHVYTHIVFMCM